MAYGYQEATIRQWKKTESKKFCFVFVYNTKREKPLHISIAILTVYELFF